MSLMSLVLSNTYLFISLSSSSVTDIFPLDIAFSSPLAALLDLFNRSRRNSSVLHINICVSVVILARPLLRPVLINTPRYNLTSSWLGSLAILSKSKSRSSRLHGKPSPGNLSLRAFMF